MFLKSVSCNVCLFAPLVSRVILLEDYTCPIVSFSSLQSHFTSSLSDFHHAFLVVFCPNMYINIKAIILFSDLFNTVQCRYMLSRASVPRHSIIKKFAGEDIENLDDLIAVISKLSRGARVPLEYVKYTDRYRNKVEKYCLSLGSFIMINLP